ncbi:Aste57867_13662 [Aphanomyces stellatus]|uniref:Aste57867_13662 protein n=1 Tax=Aphanomyces stellatus TaxID=120398 RepID=A0A485KZ86_9STRA|nr:hypothetical protein As57867_013612 [Aphanomyces stellatus]VFT90496.1 Aste57867_13662 [Aphanomyces stellatus]
MAAANTTGSAAPVIHLEFHYKEIDTMLAVGYAIATLVALWALCSHLSGTTRDGATTGFYVLLCLASLVRGVWFSTPYGVHVSGYVPQHLHIFEDGWGMLFLSEVAEMLGTLLLYSIFILMVVFWSDILHRAFDPHAYAASHPMRVFLSLAFFLLIFMSTGFLLFALDRIDSLLLLMYNDVAVALVSTICALSVVVYCCRIRTVLIAFLEVSKIETTARIQTVTRTGVLCASFLVLNAAFEAYMGFQMYRLQAVPDVPPQDSMSWWLLIMAKHLAEVFVLYALLYILWGASDAPAETRAQTEMRRHYEAIPDVASPTHNNGLPPSVAITVRKSSSAKRFVETHGGAHRP